MPAARSYKDYVDAFKAGETEDDELLRLFYLRGLDDDHAAAYSSKDLENAGNKILQVIHDTDAVHIVDILDANSEDIKPIVTGWIPQFSEFDDADKLLFILRANEGCPFADLGYMFNKDATGDAQYKYGENHYKLCYQLGLVVWAGRASRTGGTKISFLGHEYLKYDDESRRQLRAKLCFRIPLIQKELVEAKHGEIDGLQPLIDAGLSPSTTVRRRSSLKQILRAISRILPKDRDYTNNIIWS